MRVVREQMLCIVSPEWSGGEQLLIKYETQERLKCLLDDVGIVHFSSFTLLPPRPEAAGDAKPSLMLELTVDEGITPQEALSRLVYHPTEVLWDIYKGYCADVNEASQGVKNASLLKHLMQGLSVADGAFLGPRDRTVHQVLQERMLYTCAKKYAQSLPYHEKQDRTVFGLEMARWAEKHPRFVWARDSAPRSFWRAQTLAGKLSYLGSLISIFFVGLWLLIAAIGLIRSALMKTGGDLLCTTWVICVPELQRAIVVLSAIFSMGVRLVVVVFLLVLIYVLIYELLPTLVRPWRKWLEALGREIDRPSETWSSRVTYVFAWCVLVALTMVLGFAFAYVYGGMQALMDVHAWIVAPSQDWLQVPLCLYGALFAVLSVILMIGLRSLSDAGRGGNTDLFSKYLADFRRRFHRPFEDETPAAQQVHPAIEASEAKLVGGTAHMVSLTELRTPYWWSNCLTQSVLRFVTFFGYVHFTEGSLSGAAGIQYSHWHLVDGGRRLLFCANFDGTFGGYLDDFIKGPSGGTTMFWRWTHLLKRPSAALGHPAVTRDRNFPPTRLLMFRGVKCELKFKAYARASMLPHLFRYDATNLSSEQKARATALRDALFGERTDAKDDVIMRVLES
jgi:hypothetical protein